MPQTSVGQTKVRLPVNKAVGAQHAPAAAGSTAAPSVPVPSPAPLVINGRATAPIDVRTMSASDVVNTINNAGISGITASIDGQERLVISGVFSIDGDSNLRAILGV